MLVGDTLRIFTSMLYGSTLRTFISVKLKLTLTLTDTGGAVLTLMLGYRRRNYKIN